LGLEAGALKKHKGLVKKIVTDAVRESGVRWLCVHYVSGQWFVAFIMG
jgi:hypothetical protein